MPDGGLTLLDIDDVQIRSLSGTVERDWRPPFFRLAWRLTTTLDDEDLSEVGVGMDITVHGSDGPETKDESLTYSGGVSVVVRVKDGVEVSAEQLSDARLVSIIWPYLRAPIVEHAKRLGGPPILLPVAPEFPSESGA